MKGRRKMGRRVIVVYVVLALGLAALGGANQVRFKAQIELMDLKQERIAEVVSLRAAAATVHGPAAVTLWAESQGMVPAPENERIQNIAPLQPPVLPTSESGLEVRTVWQ